MAMGPPVPGWLDRVNFITSFFWQGCDAPFTLFCEFAGPPAGRAVALLIGLDMDDIVKGFFRPAGLRSHRHGRKGPRKKGRIPELPDVNDAIAKRVPGQAAFAGRPWGSPTFYAFEISDVADRVAFNVAIVDIVSDTSYQALLGILSVDPSNCPWVARGASHGEWNTILNTGDGWGNRSSPIIEYEHGLDMQAYAANLPSTGRFLVTFECAFFQDRWPYTEVAVALRNGFGGEILEETGNVGLSFGDQTTLTVSATVPAGVQPQWVVRSKGDPTASPRCRVTVTQISQ